MLTSSPLLPHPNAWCSPKHNNIVPNQQNVICHIIFYCFWISNQIYDFILFLYNYFFVTRTLYCTTIFSIWKWIKENIHHLSLFTTYTLLLNVIQLHILHHFVSSNSTKLNKWIFCLALRAWYMNCLHTNKNENSNYLPNIFSWMKWLLRNEIIFRLVGGLHRLRFPANAKQRRTLPGKVKHFHKTWNLQNRTDTREHFYTFF